MTEPSPSRLTVTVARFSAWLFMLAGVALLIYAALLVVGQAIFWLRFGSWLELPASALWHHPMRSYGSPFPLPIVPDIHEWLPLRAPGPGDWVGLRKVLLWFLDLPLALYSAFFGFLMIVTAAAEEDNLRDRGERI